MESVYRSPKSNHVHTRVMNEYNDKTIVTIHFRLLDQFLGFSLSSGSKAT